MIAVLESQLDIFSEVIHATYHAWTTPKREFYESDLVSELEILFESIVSQLLQPLWVLSLQVRQQQEDMGGSRGDEKSVRILLQSKNITPLSPVGPTFCILFSNYVKKGSLAHTEAVS